jgi:hypothetical protein
METKGEKIERLGEFLLNSFMAVELDEFLRVGGYDQVATAVRPDVGANTYFFTVVQALDQRGLINDEFFAHLRRGRARREDEIRDIQEAWVGMGTRDINRDEIERLQAEIGRLSARNQVLESRIAELQEEAAAQQTQRINYLVSFYDTSRSKQADLERGVHELAGRLDEQARANVRLQAALTAQAERRLRMCESYQGDVVDVHEDRVVVIYDVNGNVVEQTYERSQFLDGRLPEVGTELAVHVMVAEVEPQTDEPAFQEEEGDDDVSSHRREPLDEPTIF